MTRTCLSLSALLFCSVLTAGPGTEAAPAPIGDVLCDQRDRMQQRLRESLRSERAWDGLRGPDEIVELWEDARGDWILVIAHANGSTCIVAMGTALSPFDNAPHG